ncbi:MAG: radical SAM family heme chaperone HemW [Bacteroidia bacterium]|nr:radical SAM family heme chaperone HemW [Bacteroidia bacterium]
MSGVYLHIPFCKKACTYCDFHFSTSLGNVDAMVNAIVTEAELRHNYLPLNEKLESIYFGGGTPSILAPAMIERMVEKLNHLFVWDKNIEITLEANPDDIDLQNLASWKKNGINRLSIGLQSFTDDELRWMNRAHTAEESVSSVKRAQDAGFDNITIDLIYGSKFQNILSWQETLKKAIALNTQHISAYNLTIENKTALGVNHAKGKEPSVSEELSSLQFQEMRRQLLEAGFMHYEISNFGKEGFLARHNSNYWKGKSYLGLGPSAHSFNGVSRQWNLKNNAKYVQLVSSREVFFEIEQLTEKDRYNEYVLTRLRTIWGCDIEEMTNLFGEEKVRYFENGITAFKGFYEKKNNIYVLNENGKLKADGIASELFLL